MKIFKLLDQHIEEWILIAIYTAMLFIASAQIFFRYVVNFSIPWSQDLLTFMLIWSVFIGISLAVRSRRHIKVELAFVILPKRIQFYLKLLSNIVFIIFCAIFSYYALLKVHNLIYVHPQISESTGIPMWMIQIAVPIGFLLSIYRLVVDTRLLFKEREVEMNGGMD